MEAGVEFRDVPSAESAARAGVDEALAIDRHAHRCSRVSRGRDRADPFAAGLKMLMSPGPEAGRDVDEAVVGGGIVDRDRGRTAKMFFFGVRIRSSGQGIAVDVRPAAAEGDRIAVEVEPSDFRSLREVAGAEHIDELGRFDVCQVGVPPPQFGPTAKEWSSGWVVIAEADPHISAKPRAGSSAVVPNRVLGCLTRSLLLPSAIATAPVSAVAAAVLLLLPHALPVPS